MTSVWGHNCLCREGLFVALSDSSSSFEFGGELSNQSVRPLGTNLPIIVIPIAAFSVPKYTKKDL